MSCAGTPEQNGFVERKHRHIVETGLTMLINAHMPLRYWVESFTTATYLINQLPTPVLDMDTPFCKLFGKSPDYSILKIFECRCFPYLRNYVSQKLQPRSLPCMFIGYSPLHKGYRCLHPSTQRVYISRLIVFDELFLPYTDLTNIFKSCDTQAEISVYPNTDEWIKAPRQLQPSSSCDIQDCGVTEPAIPTTKSFYDATTDDSAKSHKPTPSLEHAPVLQDNVHEPGLPTVPDLTPLVEPTILAEPSMIHQTSSTSTTSTESPQNRQLPLMGIPPPLHNTSSMSTHSMQTRTRVGKHTGHVQTSFKNRALVVTTPSRQHVGLEEPISV